MPHGRLACLLGAAVLVAGIGGSAADALGVFRDGNARIVLVGDSITGLSRNMDTGFAHQMEWALKQAHPGAHPDIVALGGSGQGVGSWLGVERNSRTQGVFLDVPRTDVQAELAKPADMVMIMLGMNDVLAPYVSEDAASVENWAQSYGTLIDALRERVNPGFVGLATITMNTEDPASAKNRMIDKLNARLARVAAEKGCTLLPVAAEYRRVLEEGRRLKPDFHVTYDFVHPNEAGHLAIAIAMLTEAEESAAARLRDERLAAVWKRTVGDPPQPAYAVYSVPGPLTGNGQSFRVRFWWPTALAPAAVGTPPHVTLTAPAGWKVVPAGVDAYTGEFAVDGSPERRENVLVLQATGTPERRAEIRIPPGWLVAAKLIQPNWDGPKFDVAKARTPVDEAIERGADFTGPIKVANDQPLTWLRYFPNVNYTGLDAPASLDFAAITHAANFEGGYGARWLYSARERPVRLDVGTKVFAGDMHLIVWLNGVCQYQGLVTAEPGKHKTVDARLRQGWNALALKSNHRTWQWQVMVDVAPAGDDALDDLRYSTVPPPAAPQ